MHQRQAFFVTEWFLNVSFHGADYRREKVFGSNKCALDDRINVRLLSPIFCRGYTIKCFMMRIIKCGIAFDGAKFGVSLFTQKVSSNCNIIRIYNCLKPVTTNLTFLLWERQNHVYTDDIYIPSYSEGSWDRFLMSFLL